MTLSADECRELARVEDRRALWALTPAHSRHHRREANRHGLDALMAEYRITAEGVTHGEG